MAGSRRDGLLRIGELAARAGASTDTVRYSERLGLLGPLVRSESGYRLYSWGGLGDDSSSSGGPSGSARRSTRSGACSG